MTSLVITDGDGFDRNGTGHQLVFMEFGRRSVEAGSIGDAVDRLMKLTDSRSHCVAYAGKLHIHFDGYDTDPRELFEIPEVCAFMRALTREWSAWLHFLMGDPCQQQVSLLYALLCDVTAHRVGQQIATAFASQPQVTDAVRRLEASTVALYQLHDMPRAQLAQVLARARFLAFGER